MIKVMGLVIKVMGLVVIVTGLVVIVLILLRFLYNHCIYIVYESLR